jgi:glutathione S-transferase
MTLPPHRAVSSAAVGFVIPISTTNSKWPEGKLMPYVAVVTVVALLEFLFFGIQVARARAKYGIHAPATSGHEIFDRHFRVQMNTLEQLVMFLPTLWIFARFVSPLWAASFGFVFIIGRAVYAVSYVRDPKRRSLGFALTSLPNLIMMVWIVVWAIEAIAKDAAF